MTDQPPPSATDHPGETLLYVGGDSEAADACARELPTPDPDAMDLLVATTSGSPESRLDSWRPHVERPSANVGVVSVGDYSRSAAVGGDAPTGPDDRTVRTVSGPDDLHGIGAAITEFLNEWAGNDRRPVVCFDSLDALLESSSEAAVYQFFEQLTDHLARADAVAHVHVSVPVFYETASEDLVALFDRVVRAGETATDETGAATHDEAGAATHDETGAATPPTEPPTTDAADEESASADSDDFFFPADEAATADASATDEAPGNQAVPAFVPVERSAVFPRTAETGAGSILSTPTDVVSGLSRAGLGSLEGQPRRLALLALFGAVLIGVAVLGVLGAGLIDGVAPGGAPDAGSTGDGVGGSGVGGVAANTSTPAPSPTATVTPTATQAPTPTTTPTATATPTATPTPTTSTGGSSGGGGTGGSGSGGSTATATPTATPTPTPTATPTATPTPTPTATPTPTPTATPTPTPTETPCSSLICL